MPSGGLVPVLEKYAIVAGIICLIIVIITGLAATLQEDYWEMLVRQNLINSSLVAITLIATGILLSAFVYFMWRHR